jgi:aminodeoxyfutalosine synthase
VTRAEDLGIRSSVVTVSQDLAARVAEGERLTDQDAATLAATYDIVHLGMMADDVRRRHHGARTTFVRVATVPLSGAVPSWPSGAGEVRIAGEPASVKEAAARVAAVAAVAKDAPLSGFSLADLERLSANDGLTLRGLLEELRAAGLELVAEAPVDQLQDARRSIEEVNIAGLVLARLTVHRLPSADAMAHFRRVAELQRAVGVIRTFAPLPRTVNPALPTTGYDDVKRVALARLMVDGIASIQVDWSLYGPKLAQVALTVGADDLDSVSPEQESAAGRRRAPLEEVRRNITAASQEPVERNGRFDLVEPARAGGSQG